MRSGLHLVLITLCLAGTAQAQRAGNLVPAEPVPADFAGTQWQDSRGCLFVRATVAGSVTWLPLLDAERRPVCTDPLANGAPALPAPPNTALAAPPVEGGPATPPADGTETAGDAGAAPDAAAAEDDVLPQVAEAAEVLARVARIASGQGRDMTAEGAPDPGAPPPALAGAADPDPFAALTRMAEDTGAPAGRLIFVPPDDRVQLVHVDLPSVLVGGGDPFGMDAPMPAVVRRAAHPATTPGYHPAPARLRVAPPIPGFGPDPAPPPRVRRAAVPQGELVAWDGSSPAPFGPNRMRVPQRGPGDDPVRFDGG